MKVLFSFVFQFASVIAFSQPVMDSFNTAPVNGDSYPFQIAPYMVPGQGGSNTLWDFSSLTGDNNYVQSHDTAANGSYGNYFLNASIVKFTPGVETYYKRNVSGIEIVGINASLAGVLFDFTDTRTVIKFPFSFSNYYVDSFRAVYGNDVRVGFDTVEADGYGTLMLPGNNIFHDVLRVKTSSWYIDSINTQVAFTSDTRYNYYYPGIHVPILSITNAQTSGAVVQTVQECRFYAGTPLSLAAFDEEHALISVFPNPADGAFAIALNSNKPVRITVLNIFGQRVIDRCMVPDCHGHINLDLRTAPSGYYIVEINLEGKVYRKTVIIK